jgi:sulfide:quinone oxidoreductase
VEQGKVAFEGGEEAPFDLLVAVPVHLPPQPVKECGLAGPSGWIPADPKTLAVAGHPGVYAIGDVSVVSLPGRFKPDAPLVLPKAGVMADAQGQVVAAHIAAACKGGRSNKAFDGKGFCYLEMGDMHAMRGDGEFYRLPHPDMARRVPDMQQYLDKQRWVTDWLKRHLE